MLGSPNRPNGLDATLGAGTVLVDARYGIGLTSIDEDDVAEAQDLSARN